MDTIMKDKYVGKVLEVLFADKNHKISLITRTDLEQVFAELEQELIDTNGG